MQFKNIEKLIDLIDKSNIDEFEIIEKKDFTRLKIKKDKQKINIPFAPPLIKDSIIQGEESKLSIQKTETKPDESEDLKKNIFEVKSPVVGTFYRAPSPDSDPFVEVGSIVKKGATLCIIEAMKIMNEIEAEISGRIVKILVENAQSVEYGDILFHIEPT